MELYQEDSGSTESRASLCLVPKLKYEHVHLNSFSRMRVDLAAQVCALFCALSVYACEFSLRL